MTDDAKLIYEYSMSYEDLNNLTMAQYSSLKERLADVYEWQFGRKDHRSAIKRRARRSRNKEE